MAPPLRSTNCTAGGNATSGSLVYAWRGFKVVESTYVADSTLDVETRVGKGGFNVTSTCEFSDETCHKERVHSL